MKPLDHSNTNSSISPGATVRDGSRIIRPHLARLLGAALLALVALAGLAVPRAGAVSDEEELFRIGDQGTGAGQIQLIENVATDPVTGHVYVSQTPYAQGPNVRINEFTPWGTFVKAFGWDAAPGAVNEQQEVRIHAATGSFTLSFEAQTTGDIPFNASAATVESQLDALSSIGGLTPAPGSVAVTRAPGTPSGVTPYVYVVTFKGALAGTDVPQLAAADGSTPLSGGNPSTTHEVRTRADGTSGGTGLESCTTESACQPSSFGTGPGQFAQAPSLSVDPQGDLYALEAGSFSHRVQKFDSAGRWQLTFGPGVLDGGAAGLGTLQAGSTLVTSVTTTARGFAVGQTIIGAGIPVGARITALGFGTLTLSNPATLSGVDVALQAPTPAANNPLNEQQTIAVEGTPSAANFALTFATGEPSLTSQTVGGLVTATTSAGSSTVTSVKSMAATATLTAGSNIATKVTNSIGGSFGGEQFEPGQAISGAGIPPGTTVEAVLAEEKIVLSANATSSGTHVPLSSNPAGIGALKAGSNVVSAVSTPSAFPVGQAVTGAGIPAGTAITARGVDGSGSTLTLSANATSSGSAVALSVVPRLAPGEAISGPGIPPGTTVESVAPNGDLTLSAGATASATDIGLSAGIPYDAPAAKLQSLLEALPNIGAGNVLVSGAPGGPWTVEFKGTRFTDTDVKQIRVSEQNPFAVKSELTIKTKAQGGSAAEICTPADLAAGDDCTAGIEGSGPGGFSAAGSVAVGADGTLYVPSGEHIEEFEPNGAFKKEVTVQGGPIRNLAWNPHSAGFYVDELGSSVVRALSPDGALERSCQVGRPGPLASDPAGQLYVIDDSTSEPNARVVREFGLNCEELNSLAEAERLPVFEVSYLDLRGLAANAAGDLYVLNASANRRASLVRVFGPGPVGFEGPQALAPTIVGQFASTVQQDSATVSAFINPHFWPDARYYVQYGTGLCAVGECESEKPLPPGSLLSPKVIGSLLKSAGISLEGLAPETTYHYRFIAQSSGGGPSFGVDPDGEGPLEASAALGKEAAFTTPALFSAKADCENQAFRTGASASLPDCRAYEMVSPVDKGGGDVKALLNAIGFNNALTQSSLDGELFTYSSYRAFANPQAAPKTVQFLAARVGGQGWQSEDISPPQGNGASENYGFSTNFENEYKGFSADLCHAWLAVAAEPLLAPGASEFNPESYRRENCGTGKGGYEALLHFEPQEAGPHKMEQELQGTSADSSAAIIRADARLTPDAAAGGISETYYVSHGEVHLVCILPDGTPDPADCSAGTTPELSGNASSFGYSGHYASISHALSADGSRVYWTAADNGTGTSSKPAGAGRVYLRENPGQPQSASGCEAEKACTIKVSETKSAQPARFLGASADGSKAIYEFVEGALAGNLYEFDAESGTSTLIAKKTLGVAGAGEDLADIYLVSEEKLAGTSGASTGKPNLYLYAEGASTFIATLSRTDVPIEGAGVTVAASDVDPVPVNHAAIASPDGRRLAFISTEALTGYDNTDAASALPCGVKEGSSEGICDSEVYLYDVGTAGPICISCNPSGAEPRGRAVELVPGAGAKLPTAAALPFANDELHHPRALAADGSRLFFNSYDALSPRDTNGKEDVYEWESADSQAACEALGAEIYAAASSGCLSLISSGESPDDSQFLETDPSGRDAFFTTNASLLPQDPGLIDAYDAREGGGFPQPAATAACEGEACQGPASPPNDPTPGSASFHGAGNVAEKPDRTKHHKKHKPKKRHKRNHNNRRAGR